MDGALEPTRPCAASRDRAVVFAASSPRSLPQARFRRAAARRSCLWRGGAAACTRACGDRRAGRAPPRLTRSRSCRAPAAARARGASAVEAAAQVCRWAKGFGRAGQAWCARRAPQHAGSARRCLRRARPSPCALPGPSARPAEREMGEQHRRLEVDSAPPSGRTGTGQPVPRFERCQLRPSSRPPRGPGRARPVPKQYAAGAGARRSARGAGAVVRVVRCTMSGGSHYSAAGVRSDRPARTPSGAARLSLLPPPARLRRGGERVFSG